MNSCFVSGDGVLIRKPARFLDIAQAKVLRLLQWPAGNHMSWSGRSGHRKPANPPGAYTISPELSNPLLTA